MSDCIFLYERKNGEFESAISEKYIDKNIVIDRSSLVRSYNAFKGNAAFARASSGDKLFKIDTFTTIIESSENYIGSLDHNKSYFSNKSKEYNNYYKGFTVDRDLKGLFEDNEIIFIPIFPKAIIALGILLYIGINILFKFILPIIAIDIFLLTGRKSSIDAKLEIEKPEAFNKT